MEFSNNFFDDEIRKGFPVTTMIKRGWGAGLEVLSVVDKICKKHNIPYFAAWGTLLGAVRDNGFIPWDDDIDIAMKRADYNRFIKYAEVELPRGYTVHHIMKQDRHGACLCGVFNTYDINITEDFMDSYHGCPASIGLDIVVLDYLPRDEKEKKQLAEALDFLVSLISQYDALTLDERRNQISLVKKTLGVQIDENDSNKTVTFQLGELLEKICQMYTDEDADEITNMMVWQHAKNVHVSKKCYEVVINNKFEDITIPVPCGYDEILKVYYGDYHKDVRTGSSHNYPYFETQYIRGYRELGGIEYLPEKMMLPRAKVINNSGKKELILFIVTRVDQWKYAEPIWDRLINEKTNEADIYIMPVPYFTKDYMGNVMDCIYEGNNYPDNLPLVDYEEYDLGALRPDVIYYQDPWDEWGETIELPDEYKSDELWAVSDRLILIPSNQPDPFAESDERALKMLNHMCRYPGFLIADEIRVCQKELIGNYVDALCLFTGETTKRVWEDKIY